MVAGLMQACARIVACRSADGRTVLPVLRSEPPLVLRRTGDGATVHLVGGAAGPLGGDDLHLHVEVGDGACLTVRSVAATLAQPSPSGEQSHLRVAASVGAGGRLDWAPEPLISVFGSDHVGEIRVALAADARLRLRESLQLGRSGEGPGCLSTRLRVERSGAPLLDQELRIGEPGWDGPGGLNGAKAVVHELVVGCPAPDGRGWLRLADDAALSVMIPR